MWNVILLENVSSGTLLQLKKNVYFNTDEISFLIFILENAFFLKCLFFFENKREMICVVEWDYLWAAPWARNRPKILPIQAVMPLALPFTITSCWSGVSVSVVGAHDWVAGYIPWDPSVWGVLHSLASAGSVVKVLHRLKSGEWRKVFVVKGLTEGCIVSCLLNQLQILEIMSVCN